MSTTKQRTAPSVISARVHDAALARLHERNRARGLPLDEYDEAEYAAAVEEVEPEVLAKNVLNEALAQLGPRSEIVTKELLNERAHQILLSQGFYTYDGEYSINAPDHDTRVAAMVQAIMELGKPGEKRKDAEAVTKAARDELIADAVATGKIVQSQAPTYRQQLDDDPETTMAILAALKPAATGDYPVEPTAHEAHVRAEMLLQARGAKRDPATGELAYSADDYARALQEVLGDNNRTTDGRVIDVADDYPQA